MMGGDTPLPAGSSSADDASTSGPYSLWKNEALIHEYAAATTLGRAGVAASIREELLRRLSAKVG